ncbi:MAG TPA: PEP-CTERM sorting domain-containing protein [Rhizomicrobium sp.]|nr:PEP-CTERM sorting domain-containing protein [Rhizomicrobium sp.]
MRIASILKSALFAAAATVVGSSAALAGPLGIALPNNFYFDTTQSYETLVDPANNKLTLDGVFTVGTISSVQNGIPVYTYGAGGRFLMGEFGGFTLDLANSGPVPMTNLTVLNFTGGHINYYVHSTDTFNVNSGTVAGDISSVTTGGSLFLSAIPQARNAAGDTLTIILNGDPTDFSGSAAFADLDVTATGPGGAADPMYPFLNSDAFIGFGGDPYDLKFQGGANLASNSIFPCGNDFGVCGSNFVKGVLIPEPITLSVFGVGLAGAASFRRRKAKKA